MKLLRNIQYLYYNIVQKYIYRVLFIMHCTCYMCLYTYIIQPNTCHYIPSDGFPASCHPPQENNATCWSANGSNRDAHGEDSESMPLWQEVNIEQRPEQSP